MWIKRPNICVHPTNINIQIILAQDSVLSILLKNLGNINMAVFGFLSIVIEHVLDRSTFRELLLFWVCAQSRVSLIVAVNVLWIDLRLLLQSIIFYNFLFSLLHLTTFALSLSKKMEFGPIKRVRLLASVANIAVIFLHDARWTKISSWIRILTQLLRNLNMDLINLRIYFLDISLALHIVNLSGTVVFLESMIMVFRNNLVDFPMVLPVRSLTFLVSDDWDIWDALNIFHVIVRV